MFNNHHNVTDTKLHYRMYKSGKQWVYQAIAVGIIAAAGSYAVMSATHVVSHADSISTSQQSSVTSGTWGTANWSIQSNNGTQQLVINAGQIDTTNFNSDITSAIRSVNGNVSLNGTVTDKDGNNVSTIGLNGNVPVVTDSADHVFYGAGTLANAVSNNDTNAKIVTLTDKVSAPADSSSLFGIKNWYDKGTITTINGLSNLDTSNVTKMDNMFNSSVLQFTDSDKSAIENLNMSKTTSAYNVFSTQALDSFDTLDLSNWNLSKLSPWGNAITSTSLTHLKSIKLSPNNNGNFFWINLNFQSKTNLAGASQSSDTVFYNANIPNNVPLIDIGDSGQTNGMPWSLSGTKDNPIITISNADLSNSTQFNNNLSNLTPVMNFINANPNTQIILKNATGGDLTNIKLLENNGALFMVQYSNTTAYIQPLGQGGTLPSNVQLSNILPSTITDIDVNQQVKLSQQSDNLFANMPNLQSVNIEGTFDNSKSVSANNLFANDPNLKFVSLDALISASNLTANNIFDGDNNIQYIQSFLNQYTASLSSYKNTITFGNSNIGKNFVFNNSFGNSQLRTTDGTSNSLITLMLKNYPTGIVLLPDTATYKSSINMSLSNTNNNYNNNLATQSQSYTTRQIFPNNGNSPLTISNATSAIQNSSGQMVSWPAATSTNTTTTYNGSTVTNGTVNISNINPGTDGLLWYAMGTDNKLHVYFTDKVVSSNNLPVNDLYSINNNVVQFKDNAVINVKDLLSDKALEGAVISSHQAYSPVNMKTDNGENVVGIGYVNNQMFIATDNTIYVGGGPNMSGSQGFAIVDAMKDNVNTSYVSSRYTLNYILPTISSSYGGEYTFSGISNMINTQNVVFGDANNTVSNLTPGLFYNSTGFSGWVPQTNSPITNLTYLNLTGLKISSLRNNPNSVIGQQGFASMPNLNKLTLSDQSVLGPNAQSISLYNGKWTNGKEILTGDQLADGIAHPGDWVSDKNPDFDKLNSFVIDKLNAVNAQKSQDDKDKDTALATQKAESDKAQQDAIAKQQAEDAQHLADEIAAYQAKAAKEKADALAQLQAQADQDKATALENQQAQANTDKDNAVSQQKQTDDADKAQALANQKTESDKAQQDALNAQKAQSNKEKSDALAAQKAQDDQDKANALAQAQNDKDNAVNQLKEYYENLLNSTKGSQDKTVSDLRNELKNTSSQYEQALRDKDAQHATELANVMKDNAIKIKDAVEAEKASDDADKTHALSSQKAQSDKELSDYKNSHKQVNKKHVKAHYVKVSQHGKNFKKYVKLLRKAHVRGRQLQTPTMQVIKSTKLANGKLKLTVRIDGHKLTFTEFSKGDIHSAYYQKADFGKRKHIKIKVLRPIHMHTRSQFAPENYTHVLKKGTKLTVKGFTETNGITRFVLSNGEHITANKYFVSVIK